MAKTLFGHARVQGGQVLTGHAVSAISLGPNLAVTASQFIMNGSGSESGGVWSITASGSFAGVRQNLTIDDGDTYRVSVAWSGNDEGRTIFIFVGGGPQSLGTGASGDVVVDVVAGAVSESFQMYANNSVASDTFDFQIKSLRKVL